MNNFGPQKPKLHASLRQHKERDVKHGFKDEASSMKWETSSVNEWPNSRGQVMR